jgi:DNA-binding GntR family transcriptional regulator
VLRGGADVVFVSSGLMTMRALLAADELAKHRVDAAVVHTPTLKPFDADTVLAEVDSDRLAVTLENHTVVGGCSRRSPPRRCGAECTAPSRRWRCPTSSSPRGRCRRCTTVMDCPRSASSHRCSNGCKIDVDIQMLTLEERSMSVEAPSLLRLEKTSLREQALTALRRAITTGQLSPGTHLVETDLSDALQISRGTLREAMRQLQQEGLISAGARGRLSVRHLDTKEIKDIFDVRAALESLAASELAGRSDRADAVAQLREAVAEMMASWAASNLEDRAASNLEDRIEADLKFHRTMCHLTGNETLLHSWSSLEGSIRMSIMFAGMDRALKNMDVKRHSDIVDAIESGDVAKAAATVRDHMAGAATVLVDGAA